VDLCGAKIPQTGESICSFTDTIFCIIYLQGIASTLMNIKKGIEDIKWSLTLKEVLGTLLAIGNFLNGSEVQM
jgi:hypothetical protein